MIQKLYFSSLQIWALIPQNIKDSSSLTRFKKSIRKSKPNYPCRLCKTFLQNVVFPWLNGNPPPPPPSPFLAFNLFEFHITCSCSYYILLVKTIVAYFI